MTSGIDPWAYSRRRLKEEKELFGTLTLRGIRTQDLLTDADALLEVVRAAQKMGGAYTRETIQAAWDKHLAPVLAALPEHLK